MEKAPCLIYFHPKDEPEGFYMAMVRPDDKGSEKLILNFLHVTPSDQHNLMEAFGAQHKGITPMMISNSPVEANDMRIDTFTPLTPLTSSRSTDDGLHHYHLPGHPNGHHGQMRVAVDKHWYQNKNPPPPETLFRARAPERPKAADFRPK
jgi:hypothetical protein